MSESIHDRMTGLLTDAESTLEEVREGDTDLEDTALPDLASDAAGLLETEDPDELLAALGLGELPDGSEPETIPEAIARGEAEDLADLRAFVKLTKLAERDPDADGAESSLEDLGEALEARDGGPDEPDESAGEPAESQRDTESEDDADEDGGVAASVTDAVGDAVEGATDAGDDADLGDQLESAVRSSFDGFDEGIRNVREQLEGVRDEGSAADASSADAEDDGEPAEDDALLGDLESSDSQSRGTMYSTMAPRPLDRPDMRTPTRHSTMPDRN